MRLLYVVLMTCLSMATAGLAFDISAKDAFDWPYVLFGLLGFSWGVFAMFSPWWPR